MKATLDPHANDEIAIRQRTCQTCGMLLEDAGEFHPQAFCVWKRAGLDPWDTLNWILAGLKREPIDRVNIRDLHEAS